MRNRQRGITFIGWLFLLIPLAILGYAVIRCTPVYLNYMKVTGALESLQKEHSGEDNLNAQVLRTALEKYFDTGYVEFPTIKDISFTRAGTVWLVEAKYEDTAALFGNISLLMKFDKQVEIK